jgi:hypothetical protein
MDGDAWDATSLSWRKLLNWNPGVRKYIKNRLRRAERRLVKQELREES